MNIFSDERGKENNLFDLTTDGQETLVIFWGISFIMRIIKRHLGFGKAVKHPIAAQRQQEGLGPWSCCDLQH